MSYLGIDQSLNGTGLCVLHAGNAFGSARTVRQSARDGDQRLVRIRREIEALLPGVVGAAMEGYSFDSPNRAFDLGEVAGVVKCLLAERGIPFVVVPPATLKKFATGVPVATKGEMVGAARTAGASIDDDNQADAFFLARVAHAVRNGCIRRCEREALRGLTDPAPRRRPRRARRLVPNAI